MHSIPLSLHAASWPTERIRQRLDEVLSRGLDTEENVAGVFFRLGVERLVQVSLHAASRQLLEQEVSDYLGRERYQRREPDQEHKGYRNGYEPARMRTAEGRITVQGPQVRDGPATGFAMSTTYRSKLMGFLRGNSDVLERLAIEMYARGLSTRDIEEALEEATGDRLLSRTAVSELTETLWEEYEAFSQRDLSGFEVEYLFLDAVYESVRRQGGGKEVADMAKQVCSVPGRSARTGPRSCCT